MTTARWITADVFDGLAQLDDNSVDLIVSSPPFLALRSYLPDDHPDKHREIGAEPTPAAFIDTLLAVVAACDRVLASHGSLCIELGDTYAGSTSDGGDTHGSVKYKRGRSGGVVVGRRNTIDGWPLAKSKALIPELFAVALAYGFNPLTGQPSPAGRWRVRNQIAWCRTKTPVGALGDKWRPAHSTITVACRSANRYWDDVATRAPYNGPPPKTAHGMPRHDGGGASSNSVGAPLLDWWLINNSGFEGSHYATYPPELVVPLVKAMCPQRVCTVCGEPSRRIVEKTLIGLGWSHSKKHVALGRITTDERSISTINTIGWTDCGHNSWRNGVVLDPFAGTGTSLQVATGHGHDAIGIDLDPRNIEFARTRLGMFLVAT